MAVLLLIAFPPTPSMAKEALPRYTVDGPLPEDLTHLSLVVPPPSGGIVLASESVREDTLLGAVLDSQMIPALEQAGPPEDRLSQLTEIVDQAQVALESSGRKDDDSYFGLLPVEAHLRISFFRTLAGLIACAEEAPILKRLAALEVLREHASSPPPIGFPPETPGLFWTIGAKEQVLQNIDARVAQLSKEGSQ